jgi:high-affinity iron transporter
MQADSQPVAAANVPLIQVIDSARRARPFMGRLAQVGIIASVVLIVATLVWQALTSSGSPDPTVDGISPTAAVMDTGILVFREGLEAILVLAALTASLVRTEEGYWKPVALGASMSFIATVVTWFIVVALISSINAPALDIQAATGLLAVVVLLVIMNWFFHRVYWTGWITHHNRRKRALTETPGRSKSAIYRGLLLIGFTSVYREGFEIVLFLQSLRLKVGSHLILVGVLIGLALTAVVAMLTFVAHYKLPYKRMLVLTGIMIGMVLVVMVGEQVQEMQQANWIGTTNLSFALPDWLNTWFSIYPSAQSLIAQVLTVVFVVGSYYLARRVCARKGSAAGDSGQACILPDCDNCELSPSNSRSSESPSTAK